MEAQQGAGGAVDAEAEKQARHRELRAKLKDRKELRRNVDYQAITRAAENASRAPSEPAPASG